MQDTVDMVDDPEYEEEEPSFSDPEDFEDDIEDEGERRQENRRLSGLLVTAERRRYNGCYKASMLVTLPSGT